MINKKKEELKKKNTEQKNIKENDKQKELDLKKDGKKLLNF